MNFKYNSAYLIFSNNKNENKIGDHLEYSYLYNNCYNHIFNRLKKCSEFIKDEIVKKSKLF